MAETIEIRVVSRGARRTERDIRRIGGAARQSSRGVDLLKGALAGVSVGLLARELTRLSDASTRIDNRLNLLTGSQTVTNALFRDLTQVARDTRGELETTVDLFSRLQRSTLDLSITQRELLGLTTGVNQAFRIYGNTAAEAEAATVQFTQGLAAGALRGDELRSVLEQAPRLAIAIAEGLSEIEALGAGVRVGIGDLRDLGREGVLTAENVTAALSTQLATLREEFEKTEPTIQDAFTLLRNEALVAFRELDQDIGITQSLAAAITDLGSAIGPTVTFLRNLVEGVIEALQFVGRFVDQIGGQGTNGLVGAVVAAGIAVKVLWGILLANPISGLIVSVGLLVGTFQSLRNSTTDIAKASEELTVQINSERASIEVLTTLLDENRIVTIEQARAKITEAQARTENIRVLKEEARAQIEVAEAEIRGILARARVLQESQRGGVVGLFTDIGSNIQLIQLEGQVKNSFAAFQELREAAQGLDGDFQQNQDTIDRLNSLIESGSLVSTAASKGLREERKEAQAELERLRKAEERLAATRAKNFQDLARDVARIPTAAGAGAEALREIESIEARIQGQLDSNTIEISRAQELRTKLAFEEGLARVQAARDIIAALRDERAELALSSDELEVRNAIQQAGLELDAVSPDQLSQIREEQRLLTEANELKKERNALQERANELFASLGNRDEIAKLAEESDLLRAVVQNQGGIFDLDQISDASRRLEDIANRLRDIRLEAGQGSIFDGFSAGIQQFAEAGGQAMQEFGGQLASVTEQLSGGFADAIASAIVDGEDLGEALKGVARDAIKQLISGLIQLGIQFLVNQALSATLGAASVGIASAQAGSLAAAWAPAAALASLATSGANAIPAAAALTATTALSATLGQVGAVGLRDGGLVTGPGGPRDDIIPTMLSNGEFVVNASATRENRALLEAINGGMNRGSPEDTARRVVVNQNITTNDADSFRRSRRQIERQMRQGLDRT